jgi:hypothetical protein
MLTPFCRIIRGKALVRFVVCPIGNTNTLFRSLTTLETNGTVGPNKTYRTLRVHLSSATSSGHFGYHQVDFTSKYMDKNTEMEVTVHTLRHISLDYYSL